MERFFHVLEKFTIEEENKLKKTNGLWWKNWHWYFFTIDREIKRGIEREGAIVRDYVSEIVHNSASCKKKVVSPEKCHANEQKSNSRTTRKNKA